MVAKRVAPMKVAAINTSMKAAMKGMKVAMKTAMKTVMKKKAMKASKIANGKLRKLVVFRGSKEKTSGGLTTSQLVKNRTGKVVSKASSTSSKKRYVGSKLQAWVKACSAAKKAVGISGLVAIVGKTAQAKALYAKTKAIYTKS